MKKAMFLFGFLSQLFSGKAQLNVFGIYPEYKGSDLGLTYTKEKSTFRIWAPTAQQAKLFLYNTALNHYTSTHEMLKDKDGTWVVTLKGDQKEMRYGFRVMIDSVWSKEVVDPYAKAVSVNGLKGMVVDLKETNPNGWEKDKSPEFKNKTDAIIYELHVRDASISPTSGIKNKGKFLG